MAKKEAKKQDRATEYTTLPNGCKFTPPYINPANWEASKASVKKPWFILFSYHDPVRGVMKVKWRAGNKFKTLPERQDAARQLLTDTVADLERGLNPFTGKIDALVQPTAREPEGARFSANVPQVLSAVLHTTPAGPDHFGQDQSLGHRHNR